MSCEAEKDDIKSSTDLCNMEQVVDENFAISYLEDESYLTLYSNDIFKIDVRKKIQEFSEWFNSTGRLSLLKCNPDEMEEYIFLLLNLKKNVKQALSELSKSQIRSRQNFVCNECQEIIHIAPFCNIWSTLQNHQHIEENYIEALEMYAEDLITNEEINGDEDGSSSINNLIENVSQIDLNESEIESSKVSQNDINSFKFNFVITYDERIEAALYPRSLSEAARRKDHLPDYTIQRCGANKGMCLLCSSSLRCKNNKITSFLIRNHTAGRKHIKSSLTPANISALRRYHEFWRSQEPNYQAHQVHFIPVITTPPICRCILCQESIDYSTVIEHINNATHKNNVVKIFSSNQEKLNEFYLIDMQVAVYNIEVNTGNLSTPPAQTRPQPETNSNRRVANCVIVKSIVANENSFNLPHRLGAHSQCFVAESSGVIMCKLCHVHLKCDPVSLKKHIINEQHRQLSGIPMARYSFYCEICNLRFPDEQKWDEHFASGPIKHEDIAPNRKNQIAEYECKTCLLVLYGDELSLSRHISAREHRSSRKKAEIKLPFYIKKLFKSPSFINEESARLLREANHVAEDRNKMVHCCEDLQHVCREVYPECRAYLFGSRVSGLGNKLSDLDIFLDVGDMYYGDKNQDSQSQEHLVKRVSKLLKKHKNKFDCVVAIPSARTPIVKFLHSDTSLDCDISFRHGLGVENTKFLRFCMDIQPITQPFILLLKKWSEYCRLNEHITNYALALLAIFFLQLSGYLFSVCVVKRYNPTRSIVIDGWETINYTVPVEKMREHILPYPFDMKRLLKDFFSYFTKFDYAVQVVCPLMGHTIPKALFSDNDNGAALPFEMRSYVERLKCEDSEQFRSSSPFCVQDPFDLSHNVAKACQVGTVNKFKVLCNLTVEHLNSLE